MKRMYTIIEAGTFKYKSRQGIHSYIIRHFQLCKQAHSFKSKLSYKIKYFQL